MTRQILQKHINKNEIESHICGYVSILFVICNLAHFIFLFLLEHDMVIAANVLRQSVYTLLQNPIYRITIIMTNCFVIIIVISWVVVSETNSTLEESQTDDMDDDVDDL